MTSYIVLSCYTAKGRMAVCQFADQDEAAELFRAEGIELKNLYLTMGQYDYDLVAIVEAPSDKAMAVYLNDLADQGLLTTKTLRTLSEDEFWAIES